MEEKRCLLKKSRKFFKTDRARPRYSLPKHYRRNNLFKKNKDNRNKISNLHQTVEKVVDHSQNNLEDEQTLHGLFEDDHPTEKRDSYCSSNPLLDSKNEIIKEEGAWSKKLSAPIKFKFFKSKENRNQNSEETFCLDKTENEKIHLTVEEEICETNEVPRDTNIETFSKKDDLDYETSIMPDFKASLSVSSASDIYKRSTSNCLTSNSLFQDDDFIKHTYPLDFGKTFDSDNNMDNFQSGYINGDFLFKDEDYKLLNNINKVVSSVNAKLDESNLLAYGSCMTENKYLCLDSEEIDGMFPGSDCSMESEGIDIANIIDKLNSSRSPSNHSLHEEYADSDSESTGISLKACFDINKLMMSDDVDNEVDETLTHCHYQNDILHDFDNGFGTFELMGERECRNSNFLEDMFDGEVPDEDANKFVKYNKVGELFEVYSEENDCTVEGNSSPTEKN